MMKAVVMAAKIVTMMISKASPKRMAAAQPTSLFLLLTKR
jgi:hypothetical protein